MWPRLASAALGLWLVAAPAVVGYGDPARANDRIVGPVTAAVAAIAIWEVTRSLRRLNLLLGLWLVAAPWVLGYGVVALLHSTLAGALLIGLANLPGELKERHGGGWSALFDPDLLLEAGGTDDAPARRRTP
jgi:hypothetical protein